MLLDGTCFELPKRERRNDANGSSWSEFYPTPSATGYGSSQNEGQIPHDRPSRGTPRLETWAKRWPTPCARRPSKGDGNREGQLITEAEAFFLRFHQVLGTGEDGRPSSTADDGTSYQHSLATKSDSWPTPTSMDGKGSRRATARTEDWKSNEGTTLTDAAVTMAGGDLKRRLNP
jgi:hypothetical protein